MTLNSSYLDAFLACAQTGRFTKAAERLCITQSALSQRIKNLENELETTLIIRDPSGLRLTDQGEELLRYCQIKEQTEQQLLGRIKKKKKSGQLDGVIRIGGFSSVMRSVVLPALSPLLKANPDVRIRMITRELYELRAMLKSGEIDFMILDEKLDQENLITKSLGHEASVLIKKKGTLRREVYLDHDEADQITLRYLKKRSSKSIERQYLDDVYGIVDGVKLGLGEAVVPRHLIKLEKLIEIVNPKNALKTPVILHFYDQPFYSSLHKSVVETLEANCPELLS